MIAHLDRIWLMSADMDCDVREALVHPLIVKLELDDLAVDDLGGGRVAARVGFDLYIASEADKMAEACVSATFRLIYDMYGPSPATLEGRRDFTCQRALPDAWPAWRAWLNGTLAVMGLPPDPIPAGIPAPLLEQAGAAFDLTLEVERQHAESARQSTTHQKP